jgi:hypothetical protein
MFRTLLVCLALVLAASASAQSSRTNLGVLTCTLAEQGEPQSGPTGEERAIRCVFKPTGSGAEHTYGGQIRQVAQGRAPAGKLVMIWVVQGPSDSKIDPGLLEQSYVAAPETGAGAAKAGTTLIGERNTDIIMRAETTDNGPSGFSVTVMQLRVVTVPA